VSGLLGNTPTVCRSSYVHPAVFDLYETGAMPQTLPGSETASFEKALVKYLARQARPVDGDTLEKGRARH
jgi:DNA topoisomerase-1